MKHICLSRIACGQDSIICKKFCFALSIDLRVIRLTVEEELSGIPTFPEELGLNLTVPEDRFKWFLASILYAKRISHVIAKKTFHREVLDSGGYVRYDFSTASNLLEIMKTLKEKHGDLERLHNESISPDDLEKRLLEFKGVGPVCVNIFLRELRGIWDKADPKPSNIAVKTAQRLGVTDVKKFESTLVRLNLEYCKKKRCKECPVREFCLKPKV